MEATLRSQQRMSNRLCSVPEEQSAVLNQIGREKVLAAASQGNTWFCFVKYDFITAWDSIWHIPLNEQRNVIAKIVDSLNAGGVFIFSFGGTESEGAHTNCAMGPEVYYSSLGTNGFVALLIELGCTIKHLEFDQYPELHTFIVAQK